MIDEWSESGRFWRHQERLGYKQCPGPLVQQPTWWWMWVRALLDLDIQCRKAKVRLDDKFFRPIVKELYVEDLRAYKDPSIEHLFET